MKLSLSNKAKDAIKTGLGMVLVYGIALQLGWMNPYWAAFAVAMTSLGTVGQSLQKGIFRVAGTIPGCLMALVVLSLVPQNQWGFVAISSLWISLTTYMMLIDKERSYFWNVAGFVYLIIVMTGPSSSDTLFQHAVFRTVETAMGVIVFTLVSVFLWPRNNEGAIRKASKDLLTTQSALIDACYRSLTSSVPAKTLSQLQAQEVNQFTILGQSLQAEGSESYEVRELRPLLEKFHGISGKLMEAIDRWGIGLADFPKIDLDSVFPGLPAVFKELDSRFGEIQKIIGGSGSSYKADQIKLDLDSAALRSLSPNELASLAVFKRELENIEALTYSLLECAQELEGNSTATEQNTETGQPHKKKTGFDLPVVDLDHLRGVVFAVLTFVIGFQVFIYINPPGHAGWFQFSATLGMALAGIQQLNLINVVKSLTVASVMCLGVYVFILPTLSTFLGLGILLFLLVFTTCYFFTGLARCLALVAIINEISVQNQQTYNFAVMANSLLFTVLVFFFVFGLSYLLNTSRPEKALLKLIKRYFRSVNYLEQRQTSFHSGAGSWLDKWLFKFHRYEIKTIPAKIPAWGRFINPKLFPANTPEKVQKLVTSLHVLSLRIESLLEDGEGSIADLREQLKEIAPDSEDYYYLQGSLRGYSEASAAYEKVAGGIDWAQWREEKFS